MDDDILAQLEELMNMASSEEEIQTVLDLYDEYNANSAASELDSLLMEAETEEEIQAVIDLASEDESGVYTDYTDIGAYPTGEEEDESGSGSASDLGTIEVTIREAEPEAYFYDESGEDEGTVEYEEQHWNKEWIDREGEFHPIYRGEPTEPGSEKRQTFAFPEDAIEYVGEIGAGAGYFDIYEDDGGFSVWYTG